MRLFFAAHGLVSLLAYLAFVVLGVVPLVVGVFSSMRLFQ